MLWRFLDTGERDGVFNMAFDEQLATDLLEGSGGPTLRLFGWNPWAVSIGFNQSADEIDFERCSREGIDVVRRPTGGRAIFHARELTYSVVMEGGGKSVMSVFHDIGRALVRGLRLFGVDAQLAKQGYWSMGKGMSPSVEQNASRPRSYWNHVPCFANASRYEITVGRKKLVGSAQRRYGERSGREVVLQHCSILVGPDHRRLVDYIAGGLVLAELFEGTTELETAVGGNVDGAWLRRCIRQGFEKEWGIKFVE